MREITTKPSIGKRILRGTFSAAALLCVVSGVTLTSFDTDRIYREDISIPMQAQTEIQNVTSETPTNSATPVPTDVVIQEDPIPEATEVQVETISPSLQAATPEFFVNKDAVVRGGYYVKVNRLMNTVTVYTQDEDGDYTVPVRAMVCSVGLNGATPIGVFTTSDKYLWRELVGRVYGQYAYRVYKGILFHSVPYLRMDEGTLQEGEFNKLGEAASHGCIRMCVRDVKWIYDNIPVGSTVEIYDDENPGPLGKPSGGYVALDDQRAGWDPTDPAEDNPWAKDPKLDKTAPVIDLTEVPYSTTYEELGIIQTENGSYIKDALKSRYLNTTTIHITDEGGVLVTASVEIIDLLQDGEGNWTCTYHVYAEDEGGNITEQDETIKILEVLD